MNFTGDKWYDRLATLSILITAGLLKSAKMQSRADYGKFGGRPKAGISLDPRVGWFLMELPAPLVFAYAFYRGRRAHNAKKKKDDGEEEEGPSGWTPYVLAFLFARHYFNRTFVFPLTLRVAKGSKHSFALYNALIGAVFLCSHGYLNGRMFSELGKRYTNAWLRDPRFILGWLAFESGFWITVHSEHIMRNLRPLNGIVSEADRYKIPFGGMFEYVTNATYFGELLVWSGFVVMTWSPSALPVLLISLANLVPRSFEQHKWYIKKFGEAYPKDRKVLIPFLL